MKKKYETLSMDVVSVSPQALLKGSVVVKTSVPVTLPKDNVSVEDFQAGLDNPDGTDFKDLSF